MENVANGMLLHAFCGDNSKFTVKNKIIKNADTGIYSFLGASYNLTGNSFSNISGRGIQFFGNNPFETFVMPANLNSFVKNNVFVMDNSLSAAIMGDRINNIQVYNNKITGTGSTGIQVNFGFEPDNFNNWSVTNNDMCDLTVSNSAGATILLNKVVDSEVKNNANQIVAGSSAGDPTNIISNPKDCN